MLNELLKDEEFGRIFFAELLNQNGAELGSTQKKCLKNGHGRIQMEHWKEMN